MGIHKGEKYEQFYALAAALNEQRVNPQFVDLYQRLMTVAQELDTNLFDAKNMRFNDNATRYLCGMLKQISGNEIALRQSLLGEYHVSIIPSEGMRLCGLY